MLNHIAYRRAFNHARFSYWKKHPQGFLPAGLALPPGRRNRAHYEPDGRPLGAPPDPEAEPLDNPAPQMGAIAAARNLYSSFTGKRPHDITQVRFPPLPKAGLAFGELMELGYRSFRDGKPYRHAFTKKAQPLLIASHDGLQIVIFGGRFKFTDRGIEDK